MTKQQQPNDAERQQFERELELAQQKIVPAAPPGGAQAFPSGMTILVALGELLKDGGIKDQLLAIWKRLKGGTGPTEPPPEPSS